MASYYHSSIMTIVVESGSTKADWIFLYSDGVVEKITTSGINPSTQANFIEINDELKQSISSASHIFYYGAGVSNNLAKDSIVLWLQSMGAKCSIVVQSDMLAACVACCNDKEGIVCILGTGSNSCVFNGNEIIDSIPSLGYILGDEGSGSHIGKEILKAYFCRQMPDDVKIRFENKFPVEKDNVLDAVYKNQLGSKYIGSFASWLDEDNSSFKEKILEKVFHEFIVLRLLPLTKRFPDHAIYFVGSIAYHYQQYLIQSLNHYGLKANEILHKPLDRLIAFHQKK